MTSRWCLRERAKIVGSGRRGKVGAGRTVSIRQLRDGFPAHTEPMLPPASAIKTVTSNAESYVTEASKEDRHPN